VTKLVELLFFAAYKFSSWGVATRAAAEDGEAAALMGIRLGRVSVLSWVIAGVLAAIAAIFLVAFPTPRADEHHRSDRPPRIPRGHSWRFGLRWRSTGRGRRGGPRRDADVGV